MPEQIHPEPSPPPAVQVGSLTRDTHLDHVVMVSTTRSPRPRPADVEQLELALADHKARCATCQAGQRCDMARKLEQALAR